MIMTLKCELMNLFSTARIGDEFRLETVGTETQRQLADHTRKTLKAIFCNGTVRQSGRGVQLVFLGYHKTLHYGTNCIK